MHDFQTLVTIAIFTYSDYRIALDQLLFCFEFHLEQIRKNAVSEQPENFVLGDFNLTTAFDNISIYEQSIFSFFKQNDFAQMVQFPTHKTRNSLKPIFTNSAPSNTYPSSLLYSDHFAIFGEFVDINDLQNDSHPARQLSRGSFNKELFKALLDTLYNRMYCNQQPGSLEDFTNHILSCLPLCCSKKSKQRIVFSYYCSSHSIHVCNKIRMVKSKRNLSPYFMANLENDLNISMTLDRTLVFNNLQTNVNSAFNFLQRFRRNADNCRLQTCMIENHQSIGNIIQKTDFQNAFNSINRDNSS